MIPADINLTQKETEKKRKYRNFCTEIRQMWIMKCMIVPVIIGATGRVKKGFKKLLDNMPRKHSVDSQQKTAALGMSHIIRKVLQSET